MKKNSINYSKWRQICRPAVGHSTDERNLVAVLSVWVISIFYTMMCLSNSAKNQIFSSKHVEFYFSISSPRGFPLRLDTGILQFYFST